MIEQEISKVRIVLDEGDKFSGWPSSHYWAACTVCGGGLIVPIPTEENRAAMMPVHKYCLASLGSKEI